MCIILFLILGFVVSRSKSSLVNLRLRSFWYSYNTYGLPVNFKTNIGSSFTATIYGDEPSILKNKETFLYKCNTILSILFFFFFLYMPMGLICWQILQIELN